MLRHAGVDQGQQFSRVVRFVEGDVIDVVPRRFYDHVAGANLDGRDPPGGPGSTLIPREANHLSPPFLRATGQILSYKMSYKWRRKLPSGTFPIAHRRSSERCMPSDVGQIVAVERTDNEPGAPFLDGATRRKTL